MNEEAFLDVLHDIERAIIVIYRNDRALLDSQVLSAIESLLRCYSAEARGREVALPALSGLTQKVTADVKEVCDWQMGRIQPEKKLAPPAKTRTLDDIIACLKRIRKSIELWNKEGGLQGYLHYINNFL